MREATDVKQGSEKWIDVRKLAALDIVFHGARLILAEFAFTVIFCGFFGVLSLIGFVHNPDHPLFTLIIGLALTWIALNLLPLLLYAISIVGHHSAQQEVAFELEHRSVYAGKYSVQSLLLLVPLVIPILAIRQEYQRRSRIVQ